MAFFGITPIVMRPTALVLNILVATFTSFRFLQAGLFRWRTLWPVLLGAIPMAFLGGSIQLSTAFAGAVLLGAPVGTTLGLKLPTEGFLKALGLVLAVARLKLIGVY